MPRRLPVLLVLILVLMPAVAVLPVNHSPGDGDPVSALTFAAETDIVVEGAGDPETATPPSTETSTATVSATATDVPTETVPATAPAPDAATETPTATATETLESTVTPTATGTDVATATGTSTATAIATGTPSETATIGPTETPSPTRTATPIAGLSLSATSGRVGAVIRLQIRSFPANVRVALRFDGAREQTVMTDGSGGLRGEFTIPAATTVQHEIAAEGGGRRATRSFAVTPNIGLSTSNVRAGRPLTVSLTGFNGGASVAIRLYAVAPATGYATLARITTGSTGSVTRGVAIPADTENGLHRLVAVQSGGDDDEAAVRVQGGTATRTATVRPTRTATPRATKTPTARPTRTATPRPRATSTPRPRATSTPRPQGGCHPSYPDFCIPPPPPDLNCDDFSQRGFRVIGSDPHRLDRDNNGRACEG